MIIGVAGRRFALVSRAGKVLGVHRSRADAQAQEVAINLNKARRAGYRIPRGNKSTAARTAPRRHRRPTGGRR